MLTGARRGSELLALAAFSSARRGARMHMAGAQPHADVVVVGGGAAGLFASIAAARAGASVLCLESGSQPLRKVRISGGGRCNVMHDPSTWAPADAKQLLAGRYPRGSQELISPLLAGFSPDETAAWFRAEGVALKREADGRVFPTTDDSATVVRALLDAAERAGVRLLTGAKVEAVAHVDGADAADAGGDGARARFALDVARRGGASAERVLCGSLVLATGSASHQLAASLGHDVTGLLPSLFALRLAPGALLDASLAGLSVADAELTFEPPPPDSAQPDAPANGAAAVAVATRGKGARARGGASARRVSSRGPLLVTHRGLSGPAALRLSAHAAVPLAACGYRGDVVLNLCPALQPREVGAALVAFSRGEQRGKQVSTVSPFELPRRLWRVVVAGVPEGSSAPAPGDAVDPTARWDQLGGAELRALEGRLTRLRLPFSGKDSNKEEFVTCGGVRLDNVQMRDMRSKKHGALFFAGELLDIDGITGGHNFQSCWTTGFLAGRAAAEAARRAGAGGFDGDGGGGDKPRPGRGSAQRGGKGGGGGAALGGRLARGRAGAAGEAPPN
ncbi:hypothetical protein KFE25_011401 [Diacronema lutheri]|uniref:Aminoacetone oxidase family FAD-binding enzyme n=1 Tax=Diacronema lutheri TaxID=2081491 RepID=A0A8J6C726_DIALT|nr:hypothetical protein KFE25_011401 [Diacronema lutheri]